MNVNKQSKILFNQIKQKNKNQFLNAIFISCVLLLTSCIDKSKGHPSSIYFKQSFIQTFNGNSNNQKDLSLHCERDTSYLYLFTRKLNNYRTYPLKGKCTFQEIGDNRFIINIGFLPDFCNYLIVDATKEKYIYSKTPLQKKKDFRGLNFIYKKINQNSIESNLDLVHKDSLMFINFDFYYEQPFLFQHSMFRYEDMGNNEFTTKVCTTCRKNKETLNEIIRSEQLFSEKITRKELFKQWEKSFIKE